MDSIQMGNPFEIILNRVIAIEEILQEIRGKLDQKNNPPKDERITRRDICKLYKISLPTVHALMQKGLPYEKCGRKTLFKRESVDKFFSERRRHHDYY